MFNRDFPEHRVYTTPVYFTSDWLNEYWDTLQVDDYRFVYMGPKGSWCGDLIHACSTLIIVGFNIHLNMCLHWFCVISLSSLGPHSMLMCSAPTVGLQTSVEEKSGSYIHQGRRTFCETLTVTSLMMLRRLNFKTAAFIHDQKKLVNLLKLFKKLGKLFLCPAAGIIKFIIW